MIGEVGRQMHADEHDLKAAHEKADRQQHVAAMAECFGHRLGCRLLERVSFAFATLDHCGGERRHQQADGGQRNQRALPADVRQQPLR